MRGSRGLVLTLVNGLTAFAFLLLLLAATAPAEARKRVRGVRPIPAVQEACKAANDNRGLARCLWAAARAHSERRRIYYNVQRFMAGIYKDAASPILLPCKYQIRKSVGGGPNLQAALDQISRFEGVRFTHIPNDCASLADLIEEIRGMPVHWKKCQPAPYSYQHLEQCLRAVLERTGGAQVVRRYFERTTPNPDSAKRLPIVTFSRTLTDELKQMQFAHRNRLRWIENDAKACVSADVAPFHVGDLYAKTVTAGMADVSMKPGSKYFELQKSPTCRDVVRLATNLNLLPDQSAAYEATRVRREKERAAARAARCDVARGEKAPTAKELAHGLNDFVLNNCNKLFAVMRMLSRKQTPNPIGVAFTKVKREGTWCTVQALTVKLSLKWDNITQRRCVKLGSGRFSCHIGGFFDCRSNARNPQRGKLECALFTLPQWGLVMATYDAPACTWRAVPMEKKN